MTRRTTDPYAGNPDALLAMRTLLAMAARCSDCLGAVEVTYRPNTAEWRIGVEHDDTCPNRPTDPTEENRP